MISLRDRDGTVWTPDGSIGQGEMTYSALDGTLTGWRRREVETQYGPVVDIAESDGALKADVVRDFCAERAGFITAINNCHPDNVADYHRWQGHAEARRQLSERLGLPVAWPADYQKAGS